MEIKASAKYLRISPRKLRQLTIGWAGKPVKEVLKKLSSQPQRGREFLEKVVKQGVANAKNNFKVMGDLKVKVVEVGDGTSSKRMDKSHGARFDRGIIKKRTAHLFLTLVEEKKQETTSEVKLSEVEKGVNIEEGKEKKMVKSEAKKSKKVTEEKKK